MRPECLVCVIFLASFVYLFFFFNVSMCVLQVFKIDSSNLNICYFAFQNGMTMAMELQQQPLNLMEELDVSNYLVFKKENEDGPDVKGGHPDALIIHATRVQKNSDGKHCVLLLLPLRARAAR